MKSFVPRTHWPAILVVAMAGLIVSLAGLQAQTIPPKLEGSDRLPAGVQVGEADTGRPPSGPPSQAQLVQVLQQRGVSVDARTLAANRGRQQIRSLSRMPAEAGQPDDGRVRLQRPSQASLLRRMRQLPGGQTRLDEARRRGAPLGTSTGQAPRRGEGLYSLVSAEPASAAGPNWIPMGSDLSPTNESGDWSVLLTANDGSVIGGSLHFTNAAVAYTNQFKLRAGGCAKMALKVPADGWYMVWYMVNIASQAKWVVKAGNTAVAEFTGNGTTSFYPLVLELGSGFHWIMACNPNSSSDVQYYMSGAYDLP